MTSTSNTKRTQGRKKTTSDGSQGMLLGQEIFELRSDKKGNTSGERLGDRRNNKSKDPEAAMNLALCNDTKGTNVKKAFLISRAPRAPISSLQIISRSSGSLEQEREEVLETTELQNSAEGKLGTCAKAQAKES